MAKYAYEFHDTDSVCPYCGHGYQVECEDYDEEEREVECDECGKKYWMQQSYSVTTFTSPSCSLNDTAHVWEMKNLGNGTRHEFCTICDACKPFGDI